MSPLFNQNIRYILKVEMETWIFSISFPRDSDIQPSDLSIAIRTTVVQQLSCVWLLAMPWIVVHQASLSFTISQSVPTHVHPLSWWCNPTSLSSAPLYFCLQSFPASGSFPITQFFTSGGQSIGVSASASVLSMNTQNWAPLGWTGWISLQSKGLSRVFSNTTV